MNQQDINNLEQRIEELEKKLAEHQHLGMDGSKEFGGGTRINAKEIFIYGAGNMKSGFTVDPIRMFDGDPLDGKKHRVAADGITVLNKDTAAEQVTSGSLVGKSVDTDNVLPSNRHDFNETNFAQLLLVNATNGTPFTSGPSSFAPLAALYGNRTPASIADGSVVNGGATLLDNNANYVPNQLIGSILNVGWGPLESHKIISNTKTTITTDKPFTIVPTGSYSYQITTPLILGVTVSPFSRLMVGDDIRLGYGGSGGTQVQYIKWGEGSPDGVVTANVGSLYLRSDGGEGTTLYVKESGSSNTGWVSSPLTGITETSTNTLTNKRITPRVRIITSNAEPTINTDWYDAVSITTLTTDITSMTSNLSGTPTDFQELVIRFFAYFSDRSINWGAKFQNEGVALPTTVTAYKTLTVFLHYNSTDSKWGCVNVAEESY